MPTRREFIQTAPAAASLAAISQASDAKPLNAAAIARRHALTRELPTPNFFEGMLLGNGDVGVCVTVRPDALGLHLGKEDSWDIRVSEDHYQHVVTFKELLAMWRRAGEEARRRGRPDMLFLEQNVDFLREYTEKVTASYRKSWPRPWPCGIVWIHWDSRMTRLARQQLDPSNGLLTVELEHDDLRGAVRRVAVLCFVNWRAGHVSVSTASPAPFLSLAYYPNLDDDAGLPPPEIDAVAGARASEFTCLQSFPATAPTEAMPNPPPSERDSNVALCGRLAGAWQLEGLSESQEQLRRRGVGKRDTYTSYEGRPRVFFRAEGEQPFRLDLVLHTPRDAPDSLEHARREAARLAAVPLAELRRGHDEGWAGFWSRSAVEFEDEELERIWYHNQYFLACCLREGKVAPGLFGNWMSGRIGTAWHGDYHMNYNTQQVFWGVFSSNHVDQHLPYVELCENLLPLSEAYARDKFELPGAFFPHSAYPVPSQTIAYPAPPWGYELCETPWTVQSLWWHYAYTLDEEYLRRVYPVIRAAARFMAAYMTRGDDGKYHIIPSVSPENWGFTVDFRLNKDCIVDLALTEFLLDAAVEASKILGLDAGERAQWAGLRANMAPYPTANGPYGEVWVDVVDAPVEHVYNVPATLAPVFPAEQAGLDVREDRLEIARRTARVARLEGGNDLVFQPLARARLGMLDLDWFKREVRYCLLPNGVANDRVRQIDGRYRDSTDFDFMMRMGVWTENLSLPAVLNECLMQSYAGVIRLFPNTRNLGPARFANLRAAGAFLVSAAWDGTAVSGISIVSEKGAAARLVNPWAPRAPRVSDVGRGEAVNTRIEGSRVEFATQAGARYRVEPA
ncbi:MAG: hypothetical protein KIT09_23430 [Bryobacteraceae bacterium]|nr:hypothetical protein [Bryobacteraceae bacterium]